MPKESSQSLVASAVRESTFLADILKLKTEEYKLTVHISHFIATISGVVLTLSLGKMATEGFLSEVPLIKLGVISIVATSLVTIVVTLFTVEPAFKKDRDSNTFDYGTKLSELNREKYIGTIWSNLNNKKNLVESYGHECHKLDEVILNRFRMIKSTIIIFISGITLGGLLIILSTII